MNESLSLAGKKILVVDDTEDIRCIVSVALTGQGCEVLEAPNGAEAVKVAREKKPDVILMDCAMPVLDGWQACKMIRSHAATARIPVVMCTARDGMEDVEKCLAAGATDYIPKPLDLDRLVRCVERALAGFHLGK
jgi:CheY-like chemotaxis protein